MVLREGAGARRAARTRVRAPPEMAQTEAVWLRPVGGERAMVSEKKVIMTKSEPRRAAVHDGTRRAYLSTTN